LLVRQASSKAFNQERNPMTGERRCNRALPDGAGGGPCQGYLDRADTATAASYVAFAGAGLAAIVSGILLSAGSDETGSAAGDETRTALVPRLRACGPALASTGLGAGCRFSF
jgi:hypothetical protein